MKKLTGFLFVLVMVFGVVGTANAALEVIGTASYDSDGDGTPESYNLIYEDDSIDGGLVWLDYTKGATDWQNQVNWALGLGSNLTVNLYAGYTTDIDWGSGWRLPLTQDETYGAYVTGSEMGHLYYDSLPEAIFGNISPFNNLQYISYWSGTEYSPYPDDAWYFNFENGYQDPDYKAINLYAIAVHPGTVDAVPIPSAIWLLGSGLIGLVGFRRKFRKS